MKRSRWRFGARWSAARALWYLKAAAARLGRTPCAPDFLAEWWRGPSLATILRAFGSVRRYQTAAGLPFVSQRGRSYTAPTSCRRGHALTPDNLYHVKRGDRRIPTCRRCVLDRNKRHAVSRYVSRPGVAANHTPDALRQYWFGA